MCGITGYKSFTKHTELTSSLEHAVGTLGNRGPDHAATFIHDRVGLGHSRLSILDVSSKAHQPMTDRSGRYTLVFNGEIYNYRSLATLIDEPLVSSSDTEVLLYLLIHQGVDCLEKLNGFFAFAFYDSLEDSLLIARDRMGIKPLHYYQHEDFIAFGSEMKALLSYPVPRQLNHDSLYWYLRLTYLPAEKSMIEGVKKLLPGHYLTIKGNSVEDHSYVQLSEVALFTGNYEKAKKQTVAVLEQSVERRMIADVPLGSFLSGGTDSSVIATLAAQFNSNLNTFSIGYKNHPFFDETKFAESVANKIGSNHTTFKLTNDDLLGSLDKVVDYLDEPFADSSAIPTYILSQKVGQTMKVALSGDGADELFGGYYKHLAFQKSTQANLVNSIFQVLGSTIRKLPSSRSSKFGNLIRRLTKYSELLKLSEQERYWRLASFNNNPEQLLKKQANHAVAESFAGLFHPAGSFDLNAFLDLDLKIVLPGDMLTKVDLMSMANSLEVRVPFLDVDVVRFARSLPPAFKVANNKRKMVLQDAFEHILPKELHHRSKKGFEVPLLQWMQRELLEELDTHVFNEEFLRDQNIFAIERIMALRKQLLSNNPGDVHATLWSIYVFQKWYQKTLM